MRAPPANPFPELDASASAHAARVMDALRAAVGDAGGALPFDRYMELALYAPGLGYYAAGARKLGADGDFITAPESTPLFGRALARQVAEVIAQGGGDDVLELGPGSGALAASLLPELAALGAAPARYLLLEPSPDLAARQRERLAALEVPTAIEWIESLPATFAGTVLANEVLDAIPCERFVVRAGGVQELAVVERGTSLALTEVDARPEVERAVRAIEAELEAPFADGHAGEVRLRLPALVSTLAHSLERGLLLFIDYGLGRRELYAPLRAAGTFRVHHRHRALDDALFRPGLSDLTAWVDFTAVTEAGVAAGLELAGYTTQAHLLLGCDLAALAVAATPGAGEPAAIAQARASRDAQRLTLPDEMGERFKALGLSRGLPSLRGFALRDLAHLL